MHPLTMTALRSKPSVAQSQVEQLSLRSAQQEAVGQLPVEQPKLNGPVVKRDAATRRKIKQETTPVYQMEGRGRMGGYASNPFEEEGRQQIARQFMSAPLGGHVRRAAEGQEIFGHKVTRGEARVAEQALAGLTATGVGGAAFLAAIDELNGQTGGTMPMY